MLFYCGSEGVKMLGSFLSCLKIPLSSWQSIFTLMIKAKQSNQVKMNLTPLQSQTSHLYDPDQSHCAISSLLFIIYLYMYNVSASEVSVNCEYGKSHEFSIHCICSCMMLPMMLQLPVCVNLYLNGYRLFCIMCQCCFVFLLYLQYY